MAAVAGFSKTFAAMFSRGAAPAPAPPAPVEAPQPEAAPTVATSLAAGEHAQEMQLAARQMSAQWMAALAPEAASAPAPEAAPAPAPTPQPAHQTAASGLYGFRQRVLTQETIDRYIAIFPPEHQARILNGGAAR